MIFRNVGELKNKDSSLWEALKGWDVVVISETWVGREIGRK